jgi:hypothetical protein
MAGLLSETWITVKNCFGRLYKDTMAHQLWWVAYVDKKDQTAIYSLA